MLYAEAVFSYENAGEKLQRGGVDFYRTAKGGEAPAGWRMCVWGVGVFFPFFFLQGERKKEKSPLPPIPQDAHTLAVEANPFAWVKMCC